MLSLFSSSHFQREAGGGGLLMLPSQGKGVPAGPSLNFWSLLTPLLVNVPPPGQDPPR